MTDPLLIATIVVAAAVTAISIWSLLARACPSCTGRGWIVRSRGVCPDCAGTGER